MINCTYIFNFQILNLSNTNKFLSYFNNYYLLQFYSQFSLETCCLEKCKNTCSSVQFAIEKSSIYPDFFILLYNNSKALLKEKLLAGI